MRRLRFTALLIILIVLGNMGLTRAEETGIKGNIALPPAPLTSEEIFSLFNNKTVHSVTAVQRRKSVSYYAPNGE